MGDEKTMDILLEKLREDSEEYKNLKIADNREEKKNAIRALMNIRMPGKISEELLNLQDDYLQGELEGKGIVDLSDIPVINEKYESQFLHGDRISLWQGDITRIKVGASAAADSMKSPQARQP